MNSDIRILVSFKGHRKRHHLEKLLGSIGATRYLLDLWLTAAQQRPDGHLKDWNAKDIAIAAGYSGKPQKFVDSLLESGFLDKSGEGYCLHDWAEHQPWCCGAPRRSQQAKKAAEERWAGGRQGVEQGATGGGALDNFLSDPKLDRASELSSECKSHALSINEHKPNSDTNNAPSPSPSPIRNLSVSSPLPSPEPEPDPLPPAHAPALVLFRDNIEPLTPYVEKEIMKAVTKYGLTEVNAAIREAAIYKKRSWGYCREVLEGKAARGEVTGGRSEA